MKPTLSPEQLLRADALRAVLDIYDGHEDEPNAPDVLAYAGWVLSGDQNTVLKLAQQQAALYGYGVLDRSEVPHPTKEPYWKGRAG